MRSIIIAGGSGTRLWPLSRRLFAKQLLALKSPASLLQETYRRLVDLSSNEGICVVSGKDFDLLIERQINAVIGVKKNVHFFFEPAGKNTLPAVAWSVASITKEDPEAIIGVFSADHIIQDQHGFKKACEQAIKLAEKDYLVTFGISPDKPETGYGYIKAGKPLPGFGYEVEKFVEKPNYETACGYLSEGGYSWNSGIFFFRGRVFQKYLEQLEPEIFKAFQRIADRPEDELLLNKEFETMKSISIDYGIMEKADKVAVIPVDFGWSDLGSWDSVYQYMEKDKDGNVLQGDVLTVDSENSLLISKKGCLATVGLKDMVVVQTDDAVLICPRDRSQDVKNVVDLLKAKKSSLIEVHTTAHRPWGTYTVLEEGPGFKIKRIMVYPGQKLSLQSHEHRAEHWVVVEGEAQVTNGDKNYRLKANESTFIPQGNKHRLENPGTSNLMIIEVQTGGYVGEDDIKRFEDSYGRVP